jgi:hypothetical protein
MVEELQKTVIKLEDVVVGERSGLPVPVLNFEFNESPWYEKPDYIEGLVARLPRPYMTYDEGATPKEREKALAAELEKSNYDIRVLERWKQELRERETEFWSSIREELTGAGLGEEIVKETKRRVSQCIKKKRDAKWKIEHGLVRRGKVAMDRGDCFYPFQPEVMHQLPNPILSFVPPMVQKKIPNRHVERLRGLEGKLEIVMRIRGGYRRDLRDSNVGYSLGRTTVSGGAHSSKRKGVSGSVHMNRNLTGMSLKNKNECAKDGVDVDALQTEIIEAISDLLLDSFGKSPWFKAAIDKLRTIPSIRLLPGGKVPASHIWWTSCPEKFHVHTDTNTVPPAFLVCVSQCKGGELCFLPPEGGPTVINTSIPTVIGGSWAQYPHCNFPVRRGNRHSFVVYLDHRNLAESYKVMID